MSTIKINANVLSSQIINYQTRQQKQLAAIVEEFASISVGYHLENLEKYCKKIRLACLHTHDNVVTLDIEDVYKLFGEN